MGRPNYQYEKRQKELAKKKKKEEKKQRKLEEKKLQSGEAADQALPGSDLGENQEENQGTDQ